jgi:5,10-methylene-tetrahydrofolate dehydrogenase/methenyl tetrahydrofolate cyclohydrolase
LKAQIIDGIKIAQDIRRELKAEVDEWIARGNRRPHLTALLVGEDPASATYVKNKMQAAREVGEMYLYLFIHMFSLALMLMNEVFCFFLG